MMELCVLVLVGEQRVRGLASFPPPNLYIGAAPRERTGSELLLSPNISAEVAFPYMGISRGGGGIYCSSQHKQHPMSVPLYGHASNLPET